MDLFKLVGKIAIDSAEAKKEIRETAAEAEDLGDAVKDAAKSVDSFGDDLDKTADEAKTFGTSVKDASSVSGKSMKEIANESGKTAEELQGDAEKIAAAYREQGMDAKEAMQKAYDDIEQTAKSTHGKTDGYRQKSETSWTKLKAKVAEYKQQGMSTSQAWKKAAQDMKGSTEDASNGMVGAFKKIGAAVATYMAVDKIVAFGKGCIQAAADANASESQFTQVFGDLEAEASKSLGKIADSAGINENRMKNSFTKIAAFAKTSGMNTEDALSLTERSMIAVADSAAFYDRSLEETTESLQSFLKGNYENDAALGLSATETTRNAAANDLYGKSFNDLSEAQKQLTLLKMVEDANKLSGAMGQAARESDTWTNVTGNLQQAWTDLQAVIGKNFLDIAVQAVKRLAGAVKGLADKIPAMVAWIKEHKAEIAAVGIVLASVGAAIFLYTTSLTAAGVATTIMTAASSALAAVMGFLTSPVTLAVLAIGALVAAFVVAYKRSETFRAAIDNLKEKISAAFEKIKEAAGNIKDKLVEAWDEISGRCEPLISAIKDNLLGAFNDLKEAGSGLMEKLSALKEKFQPIADLLSGAFSSGASDASGWFDNLKTKAGDFAEGALEKLNSGITTARDIFKTFSEKAGELWDNLDPLVTLIRDNLVTAFQGMEEPLEKIKEAFGTVKATLNEHLIPALRDSLLPLWEKLKPVLMVVAGIIGAQLATAIGFAIGAINGIVSAISGFVAAFSGIIQVVSGVFSLIVGIFTGNKDLCVQAMQDIWDGVCSVFGGLWDAVSGFLQGFVEGVVGFFQGLWDTLVGHSIVPDTIDGIVDCFSGLWEKVSEFVSGFVDNVTGFFTDLKDSAVEKFTTMKTKITSIAQSVATTAGEKFNAMKAKMSNAVESAKTKVSSTFSTIKSEISSHLSNAYSTVSSKFESIKSKISSTITSAKNTVTSMVEKIKGAFNFSWSLPKLKIPHISVSGGKAPYGIAGKGSLPKFSVEWYRTAMNAPKIMTKPTIFGYNSETGQYMGGGEAGSEVVSGTNTLMQMISTAVSENNEAMLYYLQRLVQILAEYFPLILAAMEQEISMDGVVVARKISPYIDRELAKIQKIKERGGTK